MPGAVAGQLEGGYALALLVAFKVHIVVFHGLAPRTLQRGGCGGEEAGLAALFLYHHVPALVGLHPVDVGVDGGIAPVEEQTWLGEMGEGLVGVTVVHAVVGFLRAVPHREVHEVAAAAAVGPFIVGVPLHLGRPHTVHRAPVAVHALCIGIAEQLCALPEVECCRLPVQQVVARQQVDAVVVPGLFLAQAFLGTHVHVGAHHEVAAQVVLAAQVGIARGALDAGHTGVAEHGVAVQQVVVVQTVAAQRIGGPGASAVVHVAVEITVVAGLWIALVGGLGHTQQTPLAQQCQQEKGR